VSFYELNGLDEDPAEENPFNIFSHPSWKPLIDLTREKTDRIVMRTVPFLDAPLDPVEECTTRKQEIKKGSLFTYRTIKTKSRMLTAVTRQDPDVNTVWEVEHLLKDLDDLKAWLELPVREAGGVPDVSGVEETEKLLADTGIVMIDTPDPLCLAAQLFDMATFTVIAARSPKWFHRLLERFALELHARIRAVAKALPGRLWRIYGPEYASPPYLPPALFKEYVTEYDTPMVEAIQKEGGFARIHSHGNLKDILDYIVSTGCVGLDPIEPPPQGDVTLAYVRKQYGPKLVLFGNLEMSDIENLPAHDFEKKVVQALEEGTAGEGRGFVLMPSACPLGRVLPLRTLKNYEKIIEVMERWEDP
jgi:hypothetical protein